MGEKVFVKNQYGKEVTRGTAVAASAMWPGILKMPTDRKPVFPEYMTGRRIRSINSQINQYLVDGGTLSMEQMVFEKLPMLFLGGIKGGVTATETTPSQTDYAWAFGPSLTAANAPNAFTFETGDETQAYEMEFAMFKRIKFAAAMGQDAGVSCEAEFFARQISGSTFTSSLTPGTLTPMVANKSKIYIDTTWANLGVTQKTNLVKSWDLEILTGLHPKFMADGTLYFSTYGEGYIDAILTMVMEGNTTADSEWDAFRAETNRAIRVLVEGPQIGSGVVNKMQVDLFGRWEEIQPLGQEEDGNNLHVGIFHMMDDNQATPHAIDINVVCDSNVV